VPETILPERILASSLVLSLLDGVVARGHAFRFRAGGSSMFPFIRDGDIISVIPLDAPPRLGDVLAFNRGPDGNECLVVHRLVGRHAGGFLLRGDAYPMGHNDGIIPFESLLGRVARVERGGRFVYLGLGIERVLIAFLSRSGILWALMRIALRLYRLRPR